MPHQHADGFLPAIAEATARKPPSYWFPKGRKNLNEKLLKERIETLEKSLAEQEALVAKMTSLREAARKLGFTVVGGTSSEHAIKEDYKLVKAKLADAKELVHSRALCQLTWLVSNSRPCHWACLPLWVPVPQSGPSQPPLVGASREGCQ